MSATSHTPFTLTLGAGKKQLKLPLSQVDLVVPPAVNSGENICVGKRQVAVHSLNALLGLPCLPSTLNSKILLLAPPYENKALLVESIKSYGRLTAEQAKQNPKEGKETPTELLELHKLFQHSHFTAQNEGTFTQGNGQAKEKSYR